MKEKLTNANFFEILLKEIHLFYDGDGRMFKILFANNNMK